MLLMLVAVLWVMHSHVIAAEEAFHAQRFGAQWQAYRQLVRRWPNLLASVAVYRFENGTVLHTSR